MRCAFLCLAGILAIVVPATASTEEDVQLLLAELGSSASVHLQTDLGLPDLLPSDGVHRAHPVWYTGARAARGGSLGIVYPTAVRVGRELQKLQATGVEFTITPTVERILHATARWEELKAQPWLPSLTASLERSIRDLAAANGTEANQLLVDAAFGAQLPLASRLLIDEASPVNTVSPMSLTPEIPKPGEVWCYVLLLGVWTGVNHYECFDGGDNCQVRVDCRTGQPIRLQQRWGYGAR